MKKKTEPAQPDIAKMSAKLRLQACALLRLDPEKLSPGDEVLVARVGALTSVILKRRSCVARRSTLPSMSKRRKRSKLPFAPIIA